MENFIDYKKENMFNSKINHAFAIEPEISEKFYRAKLGAYDRTTESSAIYELNRLHAIPTEQAIVAHDLIKEQYASAFPIWSDNHVSWGTHFVLFGDYKRFKDKGDKLKVNLLNIPLFCKVTDAPLYSRKNHRHAFSSSIDYDSKSKAVALKSSLSSSWSDVKHTPIEFRCNNVFDSRIYGYYVGLLLAVDKWVRFKKTSDALRTYVKAGESDTFSSNTDVSVDEMTGYTLTEADKTALVHNIEKICQILKDEWLEKTEEALREYLIEFNIID